MTPTLFWILIGSFLMSAIAMVGAATVVMSQATLDRLLLPLVALAAGTLLGGAFFHMLPRGMASLDPLTGALWLVAGFATFLVLEQLLHWHHSHRGREDRRAPVTYLILVGDALHNLVGGLGIASTFIINPAAGITAWFAAAAHEIPQELGDFAVLIHGGWSRRQALLWNLVSALAFPVGAVIAYGVSQYLDVSRVALFAAGNFLYIAASDLIPEIKIEGRPAAAVLHTLAFLIGIGLMLPVALATGS